MIKWFKSQVEFPSEETGDNKIPDPTDEDFHYLMESSPSNRAKCKFCKNKINKDSVRFGLKQTFLEEAIGTNLGYFHFDCFIKMIETEKLELKINENNVIIGYLKDILSPEQQILFDKYFPDKIKQKLIGLKKFIEEHKQKTSKFDHIKNKKRKMAAIELSMIHEGIDIESTKKKQKK